MLLSGSEFLIILIEIGFYVTLSTIFTLSFICSRKKISEISDETIGVILIVAPSIFIILASVILYYVLGVRIVG